MNLLHQDRELAEDDIGNVKTQCTGKSARDTQKQQTYNITITILEFFFFFLLKKEEKVANQTGLSDGLFLNIYFFKNATV